MNPLIAHPRGVIEPHLDDGQRDEGEERLRPLRAALRLLAAPEAGEAMASFLDDASDASLGAALGARAGDTTAAVHAAFLQSDAAWKPAVRLVHQLAKFYDGDLLDQHLDEADRVACVPVRGEPLVAVPHEANPPPPKVVAQVVRRRLEGTAAGGVTTSAKGTLTLTRVDRGAVEVTVRSDKGQRRAPVVVKLPIVLLDRLFARAPPTARALALLPKAVHELSGGFADAVAQFWQMQMRAHVLPAALAPEGSVRPLGIEVVTLHTMGGHKRRTTLRAELAPSCATCICALHGVPPNPNERCVSTAVKLEISMCGQPLYERVPGCASSPRWCHTHVEATPQEDRLPYNCCGFGLQAAVACVHKMADGKSRSAVYHTFSLHGPNVLHARALIGAATRTQARTCKLVGKNADDELCRACDEGLHELAVGMDAVHRARAVATAPAHDDETLAKRDMEATDLLRASQGAVFQHYKPDGNHTLARRAEETGRTVALPAKEATCAPTHFHWFPEAPRAPRRAR